ncbi:hypothetical protein EDD80_11193 [Anseongella ginsenosidimutans]|uniref:Uncharacterized protein n=1 Tax=Anseongella ginsenosidimutans TaxID=496056 RepID=A0A4R3KMV9_9SPHI|nr:hypothetical protein [Anseongella ginsenosidimutans]QEC52010.1 hypothetical protein FRZ59_06475 [Anseongella ginsenosidimutans]TCS85690.1 hypothetical protein EDD80_11193 [Anseongella ginsenosidimutans]
MKKLHETWFAEGRIDFELKKYMLLAYLQEVNGHFHRNKLYPHLADLIFHYNNLRAFRENKDSLQKSFPRRLSKADLKQLKLIYDKIVSDDSMMQELEQIIDYALDKMDLSLREGKEIYDYVEQQLTVFPVGVLPLNPAEGYIFMTNGNNRETRVYEFQVTLFERDSERYRGIHTLFLCKYRKNFIHTYEYIKSDLIRSREKYVNPAVYGVETGLAFPVEETLLPVAKRFLVKYISNIS